MLATTYNLCTFVYTALIPPAPLALKDRTVLVLCPPEPSSELAHSLYTVTENQARPRLESEYFQNIQLEKAKARTKEAHQLL